MNQRKANTTVSTCGRCGSLVETAAPRCLQCGRRHPALFGLRPWLDRLFSIHRPLARPLALALVVIYLITVLVAQQQQDVAGDGLSRFSPGWVSLVNWFGAMFTPAIVINHEWWRLVTACLLHGGLFHMLFNGYALWQLGPLLESAYGPARLIILLVVAGIAGYLVSLPFVDISVGASGALFGLIGASIAFGKRRGGEQGAMIRGYGIQWLVIGLAFGFIMPGINNWAHGGGALAGFGVAWLFDPYGPRRGRESDGVRIGALACILVVALAIAFQVHFAFFGTHYR